MLATETKAPEATRFPFPTGTDLMALCREAGPCLTILLEPHRAGSGTRPSATTLAAALTKVTAALEEGGMSAEDAIPFLAPLRELVAEPLLQAGHQDSICLFRSPAALYCFSVRTIVEPGWHMGAHFLVTPLVLHLTDRHSFVLLALAGKHVRLLLNEGGRVTAVPMPEGVPESTAEFLHEDRDRGHGKNHTFAVRFGSENGREKSGHFRQDFMKAIDRGLQPLLRKLGLPLVLAGVEEETAAFTAVSSYPDVVPGRVHLSPDGGASDMELVQAGTVAMEQWRQASETLATLKYEQSGPGRQCTDPLVILEAARAGKVQNLFLVRAVPGNEQLRNAAVVAVLRHSGKVWLLEPEQMPGEVVMAAELRYAEDKAGE